MKISPEELKEILKEHLSFEVEKSWNNYVKFKICFDKEEICSYDTHLSDLRYDKDREEW